MGKFTKIPQSTFDEIQLDAGVLTTEFDPEHPEQFTVDKIICATTGGIQISSVPSFSDFGEDVDNVPNNMLEFKHKDSEENKISTTALGTSPKMIKLALGCAEIDDSNTATKIVPRRDVKTSDVKSIWWIGDKTNGGYVAVQLKNALSTGGYSLQTGKNAKGQTSLEFTGHTSIQNQDDSSIEFYVFDPKPTTPDTGA